jgi:hypothetical protein
MTSEYDYDDALDNYFDLKTAYDKKYNALKSKVINDNNLSIKQKRAKIQKLKIKCISCKRPVKTIFELKDNEYRAVCGDTSSPCKLNITISRPHTFNLEEETRRMKHKVNEIKKQIISLKIASIFNLINDDVIMAKFEEYNEDLNDKIELYDVTHAHKEANEDKYNRENNLRDLYSELENTILLIQENMGEYSKTSNYKYIQDSVELYNDDLREILARIQDNKYRNQFIEMDDNYKFRLIQKENNYVDNDITLIQGQVREFII